MRNWEDYSIIMPGRITEYFPADQTASIQISSSHISSSATTLQRQEKNAVLFDVPVHTASGGGYAMTFPIAVGDTCLIMFSQFGYDHWLHLDQDNEGELFGRPAPWTGRKFSIRDGLALVGFNTLPRAVQSYDPAHSQWRNIDAGQLISLDDSGDIRVLTPTELDFDAATWDVNISASAALDIPETVWTGNILVTGNETTVGNHTTTGTMLHNGPLSIIAGAGGIAELAGDFEVTGNFDIVGDIGVTGEIKGHTPGGPTTAPTVASVGTQIADALSDAGGGGTPPGGGAPTLVDTYSDQDVAGTKTFSETVVTDSPGMGFLSLASSGGIFLQSSDFLALSTISQTDAAGTLEDNWLVLARNGGVTLNYDGEQALGTASNGAFCDGKFTSNAGPFSTNVPLYVGTSAAGDAAASTVIQSTNSAGTATGYIGRATTTTLAFYASSDKRLKSNVEKADKRESLDKINQVEVVDYDMHSHIWYEGDPESFQGRQRGVIAQDFQLVFPDKVSADPMNEAPEEDQLLSVTDGGMIWELVNAVQVLSKEVEQLKGELDALKKNDEPSGDPVQHPDIVVGEGDS